MTTKINKRKLWVKVYVETSEAEKFSLGKSEKEQCAIMVKAHNAADKAVREYRI